MKQSRWPCLPRDDPGRGQADGDVFYYADGGPVTQVDRSRVARCLS